MDASLEKRHFNRISFVAEAELLAKEQRWPVLILDLSLKGALIQRPMDWPVNLKSLYTLILKLNDLKTCIQMGVRVAHISVEHVGLAIDHLDFDSFSHLKRILELNLHHELIARDLSNLIQITEG